MRDRCDGAARVAQKTVHRRGDVRGRRRGWVLFVDWDGGSESVRGLNSCLRQV